MTSSYANFWARNFGYTSPINWSKSDPRLRTIEQTENWEQDYAYRSDFERRTALVELDVLVAQELKLTLDDLLEIYKLYFPIVQQYEDNIWFDQNDRIVWTISSGLTGMGLLDETGKRVSKANWDKILADNPTELSFEAVEEILPDGPKTGERKFIGSFEKCDRVSDYKIAWQHFESLKNQRSSNYVNREAIAV